MVGCPDIPTSSASKNTKSIPIGGGLFENIFASSIKIAVPLAPSFAPKIGIDLLSGLGSSSATALVSQ